MVKLFTQETEAILSIEKQNSNRSKYNSIDAEFFSIKNCKSLLNYCKMYPGFDEEIINRRQQEKYSMDEYYYNPYLRNTELNDDLSIGNKKVKTDEQNTNVDDVLYMLNEITDFFSFRFL